MARRKEGVTDWRARMLADVAALPARTASYDHPDAIAVPVDFLMGPHGMLLGAARRRRVSVVAYVRRAAYAMVAHDLGIPLTELTLRDPRMSRETGFGVRDPEATKFGEWEIASLVGEGDDGTDPAE